MEVFIEGENEFPRDSCAVVLNTYPTLASAVAVPYYVDMIDAHELFSSVNFKDRITPPSLMPLDYKQISDSLYNSMQILPKVCFESPAFLNNLFDLSGC